MDMKFSVRITVDEPHLDFEFSVDNDTNTVKIDGAMHTFLAGIATVNDALRQLATNVLEDQLNGKAKDTVQ